MSMTKKMKLKMVMLVLLAAAVIILPLIFVRGTDFSGTDNKTPELVNTIDPGYKAWFHNPFTIQSTEMQTLLFSLQAALGAGFLGYYLGYRKGKNKSNKEG